MARLGVFQALLDDQMTWAEREAIHEAHDRADAAAIAKGDLAVLQRRVIEQRKELDKLRTALSVMCQVLGETKLLDVRLLDVRLEAEIDDLEDATGETRPAPQLTACARCGAHVPVTNTAMTGAGTVCDACFARP